MEPEKDSRIEERLLALESEIRTPVEMYNVKNKDMQCATFNLYGTSAQTAGNYTHFLIARNPLQIMWVGVVYAVTNGGACTLDVEKLTGTTAPGSGTSLLATTFDLNGTANTVLTRTGSSLVTTPGVLTLATGNRLSCLIKTGALSALEDLNITVYFKYFGRGDYQ